jgi:hypothetical protein
VRESLAYVSRVLPAARARSCKPPRKSRFLPPSSLSREAGGCCARVVRGGEASLCRPTGRWWSAENTSASGTSQGRARACRGGSGLDIAGETREGARANATRRQRSHLPSSPKKPTTSQQTIQDLSNGGGSFTDGPAAAADPPADDDVANPFAAAAAPAADDLLPLAADNGHATAAAPLDADIAPPAPLNDNSNDLAGVSTAPASSSGGGAGAPLGQPASPPAPHHPEPTGEDPRLAVERASAQRVAAAQRDEAAKKAELLAAAKAYLSKQSAERKGVVDKRRAANRAAEASSNAAAEAVPRGDAPWQRVLSIVDFHTSAQEAGAAAAGAAPTRKDPFKDLARFKACLLDAKKNSIGV